MTVAQLVQQPGREHLPYLSPCPKGRRQTWFNRSGNEISAWINNMMYSNLSKGYPTFTDFPAEDQEMWFRQFAQEFTLNPDHTNFIRDAFVHKVMDNYGKQIYEWKQKRMKMMASRLMISSAHTNKHTGEIDDGVVRDVLSLIETQKEDEETRLSQLQTDLDATSTASTNLSRIRINEIVESQEFTWNPDHTNFIRDAFVHKVMDNYGKQIYEWKQKWLINQTAHTNKHTGEIDDGVVRDVLSLIETQKEAEETRLSQLQTDLDATSTASTNLSRIRINEIVESSVPKKKGRLVGLGCRARSVPPSAPQTYVDPKVLDQLNDKDDRIAALEQKMADQEEGWEATRR
ncbi:hypothetical protein DY000_02062517 [Brassica cretica]|uniref:Retrotransposon gag domain-containing protein n=1 Tax=Brassica cretica TaxID=69181 RepID=A0ABQ7B4A5_BRACR|nr:hypothetical protein DY000_02062517 [Brassica cretica]